MDYMKTCEGDIKGFSPKIDQSEYSIPSVTFRNIGYI